MTRDDVIAAARAWVGVPYRRLGRNRQGVDCIGLLAVLGSSLGVPYADRADYTDTPSLNRELLTHLHKYLTAVPGNIGDRRGLIGVVQENRLPCHVGVFTIKHDVAHFLHAAIRRGVVEDPWAQALTHGQPMRLVELLRFPGLDM